jgi:hypothetical protein
MTKSWILATAVLGVIGFLAGSPQPAMAKCGSICRQKCDATWQRDLNLASAQACYEKWAMINAKGHAYAHEIEMRNRQTWNQLDPQERLRRQQRKH